MKKQDNNYKIISIILLIAVIIFAGLYFTKPTNNSEIQNCPEIKCDLEDIGLLDISTSTWAINEDNTSELFFDYWIENYGDSEAKDIKVRCDLYNDEDEKVLTVLDNFGNLASLSEGFGEVGVLDTTNDYDYYYDICYVEDCINCEILYQRIPELVEYIE